MLRIVVTLFEPFGAWLVRVLRLTPDPLRVILAIELIHQADSVMVKIIP